MSKIFFGEGKGIQLIRGGKMGKNEETEEKPLRISDIGFRESLDFGIQDQCFLRNPNSEIRNRPIFRPMAWKSKLILPFAKRTAAKLNRDGRHATECQDRIMHSLVRRATNTQIGKELAFETIRTYADFKNQIPIRDYEGIRPYIDEIITGKADVLWPGRPRYFAKSSGTTSGVKYLPITSDSIPNHIGSARNALFNYAVHKNDASIFDGKMIFLSGSPVLEMKKSSLLAPTPTLSASAVGGHSRFWRTLSAEQLLADAIDFGRWRQRSRKGERANEGGSLHSGGSLPDRQAGPFRGSGGRGASDFQGIPTGRLSGIVNHLIPGWLKSNQLPSYETNCIEDWEVKVNRIVEETLGMTDHTTGSLRQAQRPRPTDMVDMRVISGIPPWVQMYYEKLIAASGEATVSEIFPNYSLFVYGGVNYAPYASKLKGLVGRDIDTLETYPASEGFIAYQDTWPYEGLRLNINSGIFFEFIPVGSLPSSNPNRFTLQDVELGKDYAVIINSNAGLWGYNIGDTVQFVSRNPYRIIVSGRVEHFISAFGEHVIAKEVEHALAAACVETGISVTEFTVAPQVNPPDGGAPYHEWFIEFDETPGDLTEFRDKLEASMQAQNIYYRDLRVGNVLQALVIKKVPQHAFRNYMESLGKLGGQNKLPRLKNDRSIVDKLR
jgi:hypothetical protein